MPFSNSRTKKKALEDLFEKVSAEEAFWILGIILKGFKMGISENAVFRALHPDAQELMNVTSDLKKVCLACLDKNVRHKRQVIHSCKMKGSVP